MDVLGNHPRENKIIDYDSLMEYVNCDYGKLFYRIGVCREMGYGVDKNIASAKTVLKKL